MTNSTTPFFINGAVNIHFCLVTTVGNALILVSFVRTPSLLSSSNVLLIGLAISDLCVGLIAQPMFITWKFHQHIYPTQTVFILIIEKASRLVCSLLCAVTFMTVSSLSVDRFLAVRLHLRYHEIVTVKRVTYWVCFLWGCSVTASSLGIWRKTYFEFIAAPIACICILINAALYFKIYRVVRQHQLQISHQITKCSGAQPINMTVRLKNSFFSSLYLYLIFLVFCIPYIYIAADIFITKSSETNPTSTAQLAFEVSWTIVFIDSSLNPFLFSWRLQNVRAAVKKTLKLIFTRN